jgi:hypothetical protein
VQIQSLNGGLKAREQANRQADAARGLENIDAEADTFDGARQIERTALLKFGPEFVADQFHRDRGEVIARDRFTGGLKMRRDAKGGRKTGLEMNITGVAVTGGGDK